GRGITAVALASRFWGLGCPKIFHEVATRLALLFSFVFVLVINRYNIVPEEQYLERRFGKAFSDYCAKTRRWL
ncbi:MAG: hypothetical protein KZQ65_07395, partial [Candidatus Thiodiazotropha sp. (ex Gloverina cf. vestifex)]|nr:hypothetical protein [Candidatus Thiodiazotropha sp. (ex Gloverina cf. vestifex)]